MMYTVLKGSMMFKGWADAGHQRVWDSQLPWGWHSVSQQLLPSQLHPLLPFSFWQISQALLKVYTAKLAEPSLFCPFSLPTHSFNSINHWSHYCCHYLHHDNLIYAANFMSARPITYFRFIPVFLSASRGPEKTVPPTPDQLPSRRFWGVY